MLSRTPHVPPEEALKSRNHVAHPRLRWNIHNWLATHEYIVESLPCLGPDSHEEIDAVADSLRAAARSGAIPSDRLEQWLQDLDVASFAAKRALWYANALQPESAVDDAEEGEATYHLVVARDQLGSNSVRAFACFAVESSGETVTLLALCSLGGGVGRALIGYVVDGLPDDVRVNVTPSREWLRQTYYPKLGFSSMSNGDAVEHGTVAPSRVLMVGAGSCKRAVEEMMR